jgi:putative transposase
MYKAFKYRIYPDVAQARALADHFGHCRYIFNFALEQKISSYKQEGKALTKKEISAMLPKLKKAEETKWLSEVNSQSLQASIDNLEKAFGNFFKNKSFGFPKFKNKHEKQTFAVPQHFSLDFENGLLMLPKMKRGLKATFHRPIDGEAKSLTISKTITNKYFASVLVFMGQSPQTLPIDESQAIGIDVGVKTYAVLSNGLTFDNPKNFKKFENQIAGLQRSLSRKTKGSAKRFKVKQRIALAYEHLTNVRADFTHKLSNQIVSSYDTICLEDLNIKGLMELGDSPSKEMADASWNMFMNQIKYKAEASGKNVLLAGRFDPTSKRCPCGFIYRDLKLKDREWTCPQCGTLNDRDLNASRNIKMFAFNKLKIGREPPITPVADQIEAGNLMSGAGMPRCSAAG